MIDCASEFTVNLSIKMPVYCNVTVVYQATCCHAVRPGHDQQRE